MHALLFINNEEYCTMVNSFYGYYDNVIFNIILLFKTQFSTFFNILNVLVSGR